MTNPNLSQEKADFSILETLPQMAEPRGRHPKEESAGVKASGEFNFRICKVGDCLGKHWSKGYCSKHYSKFKKYGDPLHISDYFLPKFCKLENCNTKHYAKGYCRNHWNNFNRCGNPLGIGRKTGKLVKCLICNKEFYLPLGLLKRKHHYCSNKCWGVAFRGKNNPRWNGGISQYPNHCLMKKRRLVLLKKYPVCRICHKKPSIEIHHKDGNKSNHKWNNLVPSCRICNAKIRFAPNNNKYSRKYGMNLSQMAEKINFSVPRIWRWEKEGLLEEIIKSNPIIFLIGDNYGRTSFSLTQ